jgi:hypothetical protein
MKKKKSSEENKINANKWVSTMTVIVYLTLSLVGCVLMVLVALAWGIQFHNFDLSYNMALWTNDINNADVCNHSFNFRNLEDKYGLNENDTISYEDAYIVSSDLMQRLVLIAFTSAGAFAYGIGGLIFMLNHYIESEAEKSLTLLKIYRQRK